MLINIGSNKISKYDLLNKFNTIYNHSIKIEKDSTFKIDRSLNSSGVDSLEQIQTLYV